MNYPPWAPQVVIDAREELISKIESSEIKNQKNQIDLSNAKSASEVLDLLLGDPRMKEVWDCLRKYTVDDVNLSKELCSFVLSSLTFHDSFLDSMSNSDRQKSLDSLANTCRKLRHGIKELHLDHFPYDIFYEAYSKEISLSSGSSELVYIDLGELVPHTIVYKKVMLDRVIQDLEANIDKLKNLPGFLSPAQPDRESRLREILIYRLSNFFVGRVRSPNDAIVSMIIYVLFDVQISENSIRMKRRNRKENYGEDLASYFERIFWK